MNCSNCGKDNPAGSRFCQYCGTPMTAEGSSISATLLAKEPAYPSVPAAPIYASSSASTPTGQMGSGGKSTARIWGPFAGYGSRGPHFSWLLDDLGHQAEALHEAVTQRFNQRKVPSSEMNWQTLIAKGLLVERRPFYLIKRGITTVALYIGRFGEDLYISQVTYVKGPISIMRVAVLALMILFQLYVFYIFTGALLSYASGLLGLNFGPIFEIGGDIPFVFAICILGPLGTINLFALLLILAYGIYKFIKAKDFFAIIRESPNEFQHDDMVALELAVEETVRQSLEAIGIDTSLMPPSREQWRHQLFRF